MATMNYKPISDAYLSLLKKKKEAYPTIDGHFWLVRDGKIIDTYFDNYDYIKRVQGCNNKQVYLPASPLVQTVIKRKFSEVDESNDITKQDIQLAFNGKPMPHCCWQNSKMFMKDGDELVFGSMGWHKKSGGIHYEFGGEDWTVKQFLK
jgi:hypothetical protein